MQSPTSVVDLVGGVRYLRVKARTRLGAELEPRRGAPPGVPTAGHVERTRDFWDGVVGVRGRSEFADRWYLSYYADLDTGSSDLTWQAFAGVGYRFAWGDALIGYRHLAYRFDSANPVSEMTFSGLLVGVGFRF